MKPACKLSQSNTDNYSVIPDNLSIANRWMYFANDEGIWSTVYYYWSHSDDTASRLLEMSVSSRSSFNFRNVARPHELIQEIDNAVRIFRRDFSQESVVEHYANNRENNPDYYNINLNHSRLNYGRKYIPKTKYQSQKSNIYEKIYKMNKK